MSHVDDGTLHAYLDGELTPAEAQGVDAHVAQCPVCRNRLDEERALIARADELLGLAAPPERALPPFRPGDLQPPARLWWQVRFPLAWAATVLVALGVGTFVGSRMTGRTAPLVVDRAAEQAPVAAQSRAETVQAKVRSMLAPRPAATPVRGNAGAVAIAERKQEPDSLAASSVEVRDELRARERADRQAVPAAAPAPQPSAFVDGSEYGYVSRDTLTLDSARALLGADPQGVPGLPITGIHRARRIGYSALVVVEQALDSSTTIAVINGRPSQLVLDAVVVSAAPKADSMNPAERALLGRAAGRADSAQVTPRKADAAVPRAPTTAAKISRAAPSLFLEVRGALPADSLAALRRRLEPLKP
jgi:hypothetical protein